MSDATPSSSSFWITFAAAIGGFAIFVLILLVAYIPKQAEPLGDGIRTPAQRKAALAELHAKEIKAASTYAWADQSKGVVQLPLDRAVELTIQEINAAR
jgi:hypothetical protein